MFNFKRLEHESGASAVEMALSATIFLCLLFGMFESFVALYSYHYVSYAAREATRYAIVRGSDCSSDSTTMTNCNATPAEIQQFVYDLNLPGINVDNLTVATNWYVSNGTSPETWSTTACTATSGCNAPGNQVRVTVTYNNPLTIPFFNDIPLSLSSTSTMVISQ